MTTQNYILIPELQYWYNKTVVESMLNKNITTYPTSIPEVYLPQKSFIEMLFNESYSSTSYRYLYRKEDITDWPNMVRTRIMIYPNVSSYYMCTDATTNIYNIFNLQSDDFTLLNRLLDYRIDSTGVTIVDIVFSALSTRLSKLIYVYLDFKINNNYTYYGSQSLISASGNVLENCYESYIIELMFRFSEALNVTFNEQCVT